MKVMEVAKEIRPGDKNVGPLRLGAGRRCGLLADGLGGGCRMLAFLGAGEARRKRDAAGVMGCRGWMGRAMVRRRFAAAIRRYLIGH